MKQKDYCDREKCQYWTPPSHHSPNSYNYMMNEHRSRIAQIPDKSARRDYSTCPCFKEGERLKGRLFAPEEIRPAYDWSLGMKLYREGMSDQEIAKALGCSVAGVKWWRRQNGLPCNGRINNG